MKRKIGRYFQKIRQIKSNFFIIIGELFRMCGVDTFFGRFLANFNTYKRFCGLCFWARGPLIKIAFTKMN